MRLARLPAGARPDSPEALGLARRWAGKDAVALVLDAAARIARDRVRGDALRAAYTAAEHAIATKAGVSGDDWRRYECANSTAMGADGISLFCEKSK